MNDINALRTHLFETLQGLKDGSIDIEKAKAVSQVAGVIIDTAKVEVDYLRVTESSEGTGFIPPVETHNHPQVSQTATGTKIVDGPRTVHRLK